MIYDKNSKKYVNIEELINKKQYRKNEIMKLLEENNEKLNEIISLLKEVLKNGEGDNSGAKSKDTDST